jgi:RimJ/RimL family protein N-acetyltransferase
VFACNGASRNVIEKAGFQHEGSLFKERRLWRSTRYAVTPSGRLKSALL